MIKKVVNVISKEGLSSVPRIIKNKKYHRKPDKDTIDKIHLATETQLEKERSRTFKKNIKFSIITPLYNTPKSFLIEMLESVEHQTYFNWELCLADGSDEQHAYVGEICEEWRKNDKRICYMKLAENKGISENTNACISMASGDYFGLLDHDDCLHPSALYEAMKVIEEEAADFIYSDEAKFSGKIEDINERLNFNLKPGFGKYDLRSHNYICHFTIFSKKLLYNEQELYRKAYDGSQDHDMVLRLTEKAGKVVHIPKVLYYWRMHSNSVSMDLGVKAYAVDSALRAVKGQLDRAGEKGEVKSNLPFQTLYRISYDIPVQPLISIVVYSQSNIGTLENIEKIIQNTKYRPLEILYFSDKDIKDRQREQVALTNCGILKKENRGSMWNRGVKKADGEYIILMNDKCVPMNTDWIEELLMLCQRRDVGIAGPEICYKNGAIGYAGAALWRKSADGLKFLCTHDTINETGYEALLCHVRNTTIAIGACMMFSKKLWNELGGFSKDMISYEDIDFSIRAIKANRYNVWTCFSKIRFEGKQLMPGHSKKQREYFMEEYSDYFDKEETYHPLWELLGLV